MNWHPLLRFAFSTWESRPSLQLGDIRISDFVNSHCEDEGLIGEGGIVTAEVVDCDPRSEPAWTRLISMRTSFIYLLVLLFYLPLGFNSNSKSSFSTSNNSYLSSRYSQITNSFLSPRTIISPIPHENENSQDTLILQLISTFLQIAEVGQPNSILRRS